MCLLCMLQQFFVLSFKKLDNNQALDVASNAYIAHSALKNSDFSALLHTAYTWSFLNRNIYKRQSLIPKTYCFLTKREEQRCVSTFLTP